MSETWSRDLKELRKLVIWTFGRRALWGDGVVYNDLEEHSGDNSSDEQPKDKRAERFRGWWRAEWYRSEKAR